jgi:subtilisin family serine protease
MIKTGAAALRDTMAARGLRAGQGIRIAVMDADFRLGHRVYDSLFASGRIVDQHDFVADTSVAVSRALGSSHGATVLSLIAADWPGSMEGIAPKAQFLLYRTEDIVNELYAEEDFLAAALERAVDSGAQVINISLGYRYDFDSEPNVPYAHMNGRTRPSSLAALGAARRGALVVVAMGNEGASRFGDPTVTAPADADSIVSVGMATAAGAYCTYSSTGPTFDGRRKPELTSLGCTVRAANPATDSGAYNEAGTSVGAPVIAGVAALLRQLHPESSGVSSQHIRLALMATAAMAATPDNFVGNGLIRAAEAHRVILWEIPVSRLAADPRAVKGTVVWRDGRAVYLPWSKGLELSRASVRDVMGRGRSVHGRRAHDGRTEVISDNGLGAGIYILRIPLEGK